MNQNPEFDLARIRTPSQASLAISWCLNGVVIFVCIILALASTRFLSPFADMFQALGVELPWPTHLLIATQPWLLSSLFLALAAFTVINAFSARDFRQKRLITVRILLSALVVVGTVIFVLYLPVLTVASKLSK